MCRPRSFVGLLTTKGKLLQCPLKWVFMMYTLSLGGGFKYFLFIPLLGEMIQFDQYFSDGLKPPTRSATLRLE